MRPGTASSPWQCCASCMFKAASSAAAVVCLLVSGKCRCVCGAVPGSSSPKRQHWDWECTCCLAGRLQGRYVAGSPPQGPATRPIVAGLLVGAPSQAAGWRPLGGSYAAGCRTSAVTDASHWQMPMSCTAPGLMGAYRPTMRSPLSPCMLLAAANTLPMLESRLNTHSTANCDPAMLACNTA